MDDEGITREQLIAELLDAIRPQERPEGEGWATAKELAQAAGIATRTMREQLARGAESGKLETWQAAKNAPKFYRVKK